MKTDRELLEAAAKAAGIEIDKSVFNGGGTGNTGFDLLGNAVLDWHNGKTWNPLTDDGDALRLAVKLGLDLCVSPNSRLCAWSAVSSDWVEEPPGSDPCAAMRRAIVRAAAMAG